MTRGSITQGSITRGNTPRAGITRGRSVLVALAAFLVLLSCENLQQGNLFENFDGPPSASSIIEKYTGEDGTVAPERAAAFVRSLEEAADSPRFFRELSAADRNRLNTALSSVYEPANGVESVTTRQKAAILAGDVNMRGTAAGTTANNVIDVLNDGGIGTFEDPKALFSKILPTDARNDVEKTRRILDNLVAAGAAYEAFGTTLSDPDNAVPEGTSIGSVAQYALVAMVVRDIAGANSGTEALAQQIVNNQPISSPDWPDGPFGDEGSPLRNIFDAAGLGGVLEED